jgi:hypothetical protein
MDKGGCVEGIRMLNPVDGITARLLMEDALCRGECLIYEHH